MSAHVPESPGAAAATATIDPAEPSSRTQEAGPASVTPLGLAVYLLIGTFFGLILVKSEVVSWFRIQEMFRFHSFHMYGIIGSAVIVAGISVQLIKRLGIRTFGGQTISLPPKTWGRGVRYWLGGTIFGLGWALLGACPGPIFALIGSGITVMVLALASALLGTMAYGYLRPHLPH